MSFQPGMPSGVPAGADLGWIGRELAQIRAQLRESLAASADTVRPIVQDLAAKQAALEAAQADLAAQQTYLASLISRDASIGTFSTGPLTNDSTFHLIGDQVVIPDVPIPTGKVRVTLSCSEASIDPGTNAVVAAVCFAIDGQWTLDPETKYTRLYTAGNQVGVSLSRDGTETLTPGTYTFRAQAGYWSSGSSTASINFAGIRLLVEVVGSD